MAARPELPNSAAAIKLLAEYSALPEQSYPLNVRLPSPVCHEYAFSFPNLPKEPIFSARHTRKFEIHSPEEVARRIGS